MTYLCQISNPHLGAWVQALSFLKESAGHIDVGYDNSIWCHDYDVYDPLLN